MYEAVYWFKSLYFFKEKIISIKFGSLTSANIFASNFEKIINQNNEEIISNFSYSLCCNCM